MHPTWDTRIALQHLHDALTFARVYSVWNQAQPLCDSQRRIVAHIPKGRSTARFRYIGHTSIKR